MKLQYYTSYPVDSFRTSKVTPKYLSNTLWNACNIKIRYQTNHSMYLKSNVSKLHKIFFSFSLSLFSLFFLPSFLSSSSIFLFFFPLIKEGFIKEKDTEYTRKSVQVRKGKQNNYVVAVIIIIQQSSPFTG